MPRKIFSLIVLLACATLAQAQGFPTRAITIIVPFSAGGPSDAHVRQFAAAYSRQLKVPVIVENVPGGGGHIGPARVAKAAADGYTLLQHNLGFATAPALYKNIEYNPLTDFESVGTLVFDPSCLMARHDFPAASFKDVLAYLKANQEKIQFGEGGGPSLLSALLFMAHTGTKMQLIPYKGTGPAMNDLLAGRLDLLSNSASIVGPMIKAGKVKAIGITGRQRVTNLPDVPTLDEQGLTGFDMVVWTSVFAPKNLPRPVHDRLAEALWASLNDPDLRAHFLRNGGIIASQQQASPAGTQAMVRAEVEKWGKVLKNAGVQPE